MAGVGTTSTTAAALKQYWHKFFLKNLYDNLAFVGLTTKAKVPTGNGTTVWWVGVNKVNPVGATLSEGADPTATSSAARRVSGVLSEYGKLVKNSRLLMDTSIDGFKEQIMMDLAKDAAKLLDDTVLAKALGTGNTNVVYAKAKVHRSDVVKACTASVAEIRKTVRLLELSSVPRYPDGFYVGLIHPDVKYDLQSDSAWTNITTYRDTVKYDIPGEVGKIYGVRFATAPTIPILVNSGSANVDLYRTLVFGPGYIGQSELGGLEIIINEPGRNSELRQFNTYGYRFVMATERLHNQRCIRLETSATLGSN